MKKIIKPLCWLMIAMLAPSFVVAQTGTQTFQAGVHYIELAEPVLVRDTSKIEVVEVFRYDCPGCYQFDSVVKPWRDKLAADVKFEYLPAPLDKLREHYAKGFYTARALGILAQVHGRIFEAIHVQRQRLQNPEDIIELFANQGADESTALKTYNSFGVGSLVKQAGSRIRSYQAYTTPELVIQGKYRVEINGEVNSYQDLLDVADFLIAKVRSESAG